MTVAAPVDGRQRAAAIAGGLGVQGAARLLPEDRRHAAEVSTQRRNLWLRGQGTTVSPS